MEELSYPLLKVPFEQANKFFRLFHKQITREMISIQKAIDEINTQQDQINALTNISEQIFHIQEETKRFLTAQEAEIQVSMDRSKFLQQNEASDTKEKHHNRLITDYLLGTGHVKSAKQFMEIKELDTLVEYKLYIECQSILKDLKQHQLLTAITWCTENGSRLRRLQSPLEFTLRLQEFLELVRSDCKLEAIQYAQTYLTPLSMQYEDKEIQKNMMEAIQEAMATLAYKTPSDCGKDTTYARLFAVERWEMLQETFRTTFCEVYGIHNPSSLWIALYAGLSSLNTRMCRRTRDAWEAARATNESVTDGASSNGEGRRETSENKRHNESQSPQRNKKSKLLKFRDLTTEVTSNRKHHNHMVKIKSDKGDPSSHVAPPLCPTCSDIGSQLVKGLPFAHHPHSRLVCRITETVMDHSNPPFVLPNGHVYSRQAIDRLVKDNIPHASTQGSGSKSTEITSRSSIHDTNTTSLSTQGIITCPETQEIYSMADLKPVFII